MLSRDELKALIREVLLEMEQEKKEQASISEYYAAAAQERREKRERREKADAELERRQLEERIFELEHKSFS